MTDICLFYDHDDYPIVTGIVEALSHKWDVWWDESIGHGAWDKQVEESLSNTMSVLVVWSASSIKNDIVKDEVHRAKELGLPIFPVRIHDVKPPMGFGSLVSTDLLDWNQDPDRRDFKRLVNRIEGSVTPSKENEQVMDRLPQLSIMGKQIELPCFLFSVSSFETRLLPDAALKALCLAEVEAILVSAYDCYYSNDKSQFTNSLEQAKNGTIFVHLDSGNYEAYRKEDGTNNDSGKNVRENKRTWERKMFLDVTRAVPFDLAFCFDNLNPPATSSAVAEDVISRTISDRNESSANAICPIIHVPYDEKKEDSRTDLLLEAVLGVAAKLKPPVVAVPERELGKGILQRAENVARIRKTLNSLGYYQPLHLLGTGNPLSIAIFSAAGADLFDGLEWCRTVVDADTGLLYHYQHYDFFRHQSGRIQNPIVRKALESPLIPFDAKVAFHNIEFLKSWMVDIRRHVLKGEIGKFLDSFLPKGSYYRLSKAIPGCR